MDATVESFQGGREVRPMKVDQTGTGKDSECFSRLVMAPKKKETDLLGRETDRQKGRNENAEYV